MKSLVNPRYLIVLAAVFVVAVVMACSTSGSDDSGSFGFAGGSGAVTESAAMRGDDAAYDGNEMAFPAATAAPPRVADQKTVDSADFDEEFAFEIGESDDVVSTGSGGSAALENEIASATEGRVIIRTADIDVTVENVENTLDDISNITNAAGGWVVTSSQPRNYTGSISIRVPADRFEDVIEQLTDLAVKVKSVSTRSEDFTEEFTDVTARAQTLSDTLERLRVLYDRAFTVEDAITIQKEITSVQSDLESLEARLNFLSQSSAFSFISVSLESVPVAIAIDAGEDIAAAVGHSVTYRAKFTPPEGMEEFTVTWNFGDGSREQATNRYAPTGNGDEVITAPVLHWFERDEDSPFIVTVELRGAGDAGIAEGEDTLVTTVSRLPVIEVFAGEEEIVEAGSEVEFSASFTRPVGVTEISYSWNFGDGSAPVEGALAADDDASRVNVTHVYENHRPYAYEAVLTITGQTEVGEVEATDTVWVSVRETLGVKASELDAGSTVRDASRTLQSVGVFVAQLLLWVLILSPAWLVVGGGLYLLMKRRGSIRIPRRNTESSEG